MPWERVSSGKYDHSLATESILTRSLVFLSQTSTVPTAALECKMYIMILEPVMSIFPAVGGAAWDVSQMMALKGGAQ